MRAALAARAARRAAEAPRIRIIKPAPKISAIGRLRQLAATYDAGLDPAVRSWISGQRPATRSGSYAAQIQKRWDYIIRSTDALGIALDEALRTIWPNDAAEVLAYARQKGNRRP